MTVNFPLTPEVDDTVTGPDGQVWRWDGVKWTAVAGISEHEHAHDDGEY